MDEIRNRYSLKFKDKEGTPEEEEKVDKSNIYKYSSNMRKDKARSSSVPSRDSYGRASTQSAEKRRPKDPKSKRDEGKVKKHTSCIFWDKIMSFNI